MSNALMDENIFVMLDALESIGQQLEYARVILDTLTDCYHIDDTEISKEQLEVIVDNIGNIGIVFALIRELIYGSEKKAKETVNHYYAAGKKDTTEPKKEGGTAKKKCQPHRDASQQRRRKTD